MSHIGYTSVASPSSVFSSCDLIIKLEIIRNYGEDHEGVVDKNYAKFRCSEAKILDIYFKDNRKCDSYFTSYKTYYIGDIIGEENGQLWYYLTEDAAYWDNIHIHDGEVKKYYHNGVLESRSNIVNNELHGDCEYYPFDGSGKLANKCTYFEGKLYDQTFYYGSGNVSSKRIYKDGKRDAKVTSYFESGLVEKVYNNVNGMFDGEMIEYYDECSCLAVESKYGIVRKRTIFANRQRQMYTSYHKDGTVNERMLYDNGEPIPACTNDKLFSLEDKVKALEEIIEKLQDQIKTNDEFRRYQNY